MAFFRPILSPEKYSFILNGEYSETPCSCFMMMMMPLMMTLKAVSFKSRTVAVYEQSLNYSTFKCCHLEKYSLKNTLTC